MTNTIQVSIEVSNNQLKEELIALLSALNFDAFEEKEDELLGFLQQENFNLETVTSVLSTYNVPFNVTTIEAQNWNAVWESNFQPVLVGNFCAIRAHFHPTFPNVQHEILITPKMSFGTGHHATTYMMISQMAKLDFKDKRVADFGTGTGILAILAEKLGSKFIWATDHDEWSIDNSKENIEKNGCKNITVEKMEGFHTDQKFNIILANINKNIILENLDDLLLGLNKNGQILFSGLLKEDEREVIEIVKNKGLKSISTVERNNWICLLFESGH